jgi:hypothetical protein
LLAGQYKKYFITELDNKKFKVSKLTLPAKAQWEALIKHPIKDCDDNLTTLEDCFDKPEQVEIDNPGMFNFWQSLSQESGLEIDYLQTHLFKRNDKGELSKKLGVIPTGVFNQKIKTEAKLKILENNARLKKSFGVDFKVTKDSIPQSSFC